MAVYDRVDKHKRRAINAHKRYNKDLAICWKTGILPKGTLIMMKIESLISDFKLWWKLRQ